MKMSITGSATARPGRMYRFKSQKLVWPAGVVFVLLLLAGSLLHPHVRNQLQDNRISQMIPSFSASNQPKAMSRLRIMFVESKGAHDEVLFALKETWGHIEEAELNTFQWTLNHFGSRDMYDQLPIRANANHPASHINMTHEWSGINAPPDILVVTTCE